MGEREGEFQVGSTFIVEPDTGLDLMKRSIMN